MKIVFTTNIDAYRPSMFPSTLPYVPRKGEWIEVIPSWINHINSIKLPTRLEVVSVTYRQLRSDLPEYCAIIELWYNKTDVAISIAAGGKPL